jgi:hypothetical protein
VHHIQRQLEQINPFKEERALLLKENRKTLVGRHHRGIGFDLSEVGIDGQVDGRGRRERVLRGQAQIVLNRLILYY